jgi:ferredoxin-NADP reductase
VLPFRWSAPEFSPVLKRTGSWADAAKALEAEKIRETWRPFVVTGITDESATIKSFVLEPADGGGVVNYEPGQHLPVRVTLKDGTCEIRNYTLSAAPNGRSYRISVKREGVVSSWLHEATTGSHVEAKAPRGGFFYRESTRPMVMLSAGVGVTPMMAMLDALLINLGRTRHFAPMIFIHGARNRSEQGFAEVLRAKAGLHNNLTLHIRYSRPGPADVLGEDYHSEGRIDLELVERLRPPEDCDFYLCGPASFMQALYDGLRARGVPNRRIQMETFGPSSVKRKPDGGVNAATAPVEVRFLRSDRRALWRPGDGSLLEFAEAQGIAAANSCRIGSCGTCVTRLVEGAVDYEQMPVADVPDGMALICCSTPRLPPDGGGSAYVALDL